MSIPELVERFTLERVGASPAVFDFQKLDHFNGVYLRALDADAYAHALVLYLGEQGYDWDAELVRATRPARAGEDREAVRVSRSSPASSSGTSSPTRRCSTGGSSRKPSGRSPRSSRSRPRRSSRRCARSRSSST